MPVSISISMPMPISGSPTWSLPSLITYRWRSVISIPTAIATSWRFILTRAVWWRSILPAITAMPFVESGSTLSSQHRGKRSQSNELHFPTNLNLSLWFFPLEFKIYSTAESSIFRKRSHSSIGRRIGLEIKVSIATGLQNQILCSNPLRKFVEEMNLGRKLSTFSCRLTIWLNRDNFLEELKSIKYHRTSFREKKILSVAIPKQYNLKSN